MTAKELVKLTFHKNAKGNLCCFKHLAVQCHLEIYDLSHCDLTHLPYIIAGHYHCPVTFKIFNANTHIAAVAVSGNVYAYEVDLSVLLYAAHLPKGLTKCNVCLSHL